MNYSQIPHLVRRALRACAGSLCLALICSGCATWHPEMQDMTAAYDSTIEVHQRQVILLNLLRASRNLPMSFTTIPTWTGSAGITTTTGLANQTFAQLLGRPGANLSVDVNRNFNFTLSSLDNAEFMKGFLADIPLEQFHVFASSAQEQPELIYSLFVASITLNPDRPQARRYRNQPDPVNFHAFQNTLQQLLAAGLKTEVQRSLKPIGPPLNKQELIEVLKASGSSLKGLIEITSAPVEGGPGYQVMQVDEGYRFCLQGEGGRPVFGYAPAMACGMPSNPILALPPGIEMWDGVLVDVRSTRDVFKYLGQVLNQVLTQPGAELPSVAGKPLLRVIQGKPAEGTPTVATVHYLGQVYFVPLDESSHSAAVFEVLAALLAMNKISGSIPASPGILIR